MAPAPRATEQVPATAPAAGTTPTKPKQRLPRFTAVFVVAGLLAVAYAMMRRRE